MTFSDSYYDVQQAIIALKGTPIVAHHSPADLAAELFTRPQDQRTQRFLRSIIAAGRL